MTQTPDNESQKSYEAIIALGSNLGDRVGYFERALRLLFNDGNTILIGCSQWYQTQPVGGPDNQGIYLNGTIAIKTRLSAETLLDLLLNIELTLGRKREVENGPRTIDLDLILFENVEIKTESLQLPHPRFEERNFVLCPLRDLLKSASLKSDYWTPFKDLYKDYTSDEGIDASLSPSLFFLKTCITS